MSAAAGALSPAMAGPLLQLDDVVQRLRPYTRSYVGIRAIEVASIVGSDSRAADFDREFNPLRPVLRERLRRLARAFPTSAFAPIVVHKVGDAYFVVDGHHRVAIARARGLETLDAEVYELTARWQLSADADLHELQHAEQERLFMAESGLADAQPTACIRFTHAVGYRQLLEVVQIHGYELMQETGRRLERGEIAGDWYSRVYAPALQLIEHERIELPCDDPTPSDAFLWLWEQRRSLSVERGPQQLSDVVRMAVDGCFRRRRLLRRGLRRRHGDAEPCSSGTAPRQPQRSTATSAGGVTRTASPPRGRATEPA
jgi:hypothetical protein